MENLTDRRRQLIDGFTPDEYAAEQQSIYYYAFGTDWDPEEVLTAAPVAVADNAEKEDRYEYDDERDDEEAA